MTESPIESAQIDTFIVKFCSLLVSQRLYEPSFLHIFWHWISLTSLISKLKGKICKNACSTLHNTIKSQPRHAFTFSHWLIFYLSAPDVIGYLYLYQNKSEGRHQSSFMFSTCYKVAYLLCSPRSKHLLAIARLY